jgi:hypothetical protein
MEAQIVRTMEISNGIVGNRACDLQCSNTASKNYVVNFSLLRRMEKLFYFTMLIGPALRDFLKAQSAWERNWSGKG